MPRIIVTTDPVSSELTDETPVLLDEPGHAAAQLIERLAWAISDAENSERARSERRAWQDRSARNRRPATRPRASRSARAISA
jgi:MinD-like ATPase involved in chromosome partitioning or flagellar assembly